jgi:hypothetical protein
MRLAERRRAATATAIATTCSLEPPLEDVGLEHHGVPDWLVSGAGFVS